MMLSKILPLVFNHLQESPTLSHLLSWLPYTLIVSTNQTTGWPSTVMSAYPRAFAYAVLFLWNPTLVSPGPALDPSLLDSHLSFQAHLKCSFLYTVFLYPHNHM